jgi:uncharacterized integral membrane protein (TIGR00698 family)
LSGGAVAICGASAALAISAVLPRTKESERFTLMVVVTVTVLSTVAMVAYPLIARALHLPPELAGLFLGGTIHDVAQVVGAGYMIDHPTGDYATIVKLFRVSMLAVVVVVVSSHVQDRARAGRTRDRRQRWQGRCQKQPLVPWFLWVFVILVAINSLGFVPAEVGKGLSDVSRLCLVVAIAALGIKTSFQQLAEAGWRPFTLLLIETVWMAAFVLSRNVRAPARAPLRYGRPTRRGVGCSDTRGSGYLLLRLLLPHDVAGWSARHSGARSACCCASPWPPMSRP